MSNPFPPAIVIPTSKYRISSSGGLAISFIYYHPDPGVQISHYSVRRKAVGGSYEFWTGAAWGAETYIATTAVASGTQINLAAITTGWSSGTNYQVSVAVKASGVNSSYASDVLVQCVTNGTLTVTQPAAGTQTNTRPMIAWTYVATPGRQRSYKAAIYSAAAYGAGGFDASTVASQATATWIMSDYTTDSAAWNVTPDVDLTSGVTYKAYVNVIDDGGLQSGWVASSAFTMSLTPPPAPAITLTPQPSLGAVDILMSSSFNLLSVDASSFATSVGEWDDLQVASITRVATDGGAGQIQGEGITYAQMDALHASFTAQDTAYASFTAEKAFQNSLVPTITTPTGLLGYAAVASTAYSFTCGIRAVTGTPTATAILKWYQSSGAASAITPTSTGSGVVLNTSTYAEVSIKNITSPADAAFVAVQITVSPLVQGAQVLMQAAALAKASDVAWTPGGSSAGVKFILERRVGASGTWKPVWAMSRANPLSPLVLVTATVRVRDRGYPIGRNDVTYRGYAVSTAGGITVYSAATTIAGPALQSEAWLRDPDSASGDVIAYQASHSMSREVPSQSFSPEGAAEMVVLHSSSPTGKKINLDLHAFDLASHDKIIALLTSKKTLHLQRSIGGEAYFCRVTGAISIGQVRVGPTSSEVTLARHYHKISAEVTVVADKDVTSATFI